KLVPIEEIKSPKLQKILSNMKEALESQEDGVAIAAPQIGVPLRIFVVSHRAFEVQGNLVKDNSLQDFEDTYKDLIFINPEIVKLSKKKEWLDEGCLSVRWLYGEVNRFTNATVSAYDEHGEKFTRGAGGLLAQIFQHEIDHLDGILFTDKAENIQEVLPQK
ncbi:Peptide deformylase, partial [hydrothermal vent metagenome]